MKLLLVEDDIEISQMLKSYLEAENYEVICAVDGEEACEKFEKESYSLVLLDLMIPKISGMEVMQHIRTHSTVPVSYTHLDVYKRQRLPTQCLN